VSSFYSVVQCYSRLLCCSAAWCIQDPCISLSNCIEPHSPPLTSVYVCVCSDHGDFVKSLIFGGLDGIITTFAIVAAVAGSDMDTDVVILMGIANLLADGISMGLGDYLSEVAENNFVKKEREREMW
jgi:hypothetical protein